MTNFKNLHLLQHLQVIGTRHSDAKLKWRHTTCSEGGESSCTAGTVRPGTGTVHLTLVQLNQSYCGSESVSETSLQNTLALNFQCLHHFCRCRPKFTPWPWEWSWKSLGLCVQFAFQNAEFWVWYRYLTFKWPSRSLPVGPEVRYFDSPWSIASSKT